MSAGQQQEQTRPRDARPPRDRIDASDVVVVGAGVAGLSAARGLARAGLRVTVLESGDRVGGQLRTATLDGTVVDVGAESVHLGPPGAAALLIELGLREGAVEARPSRTLVWTGRGVRPLPDGVTPTGPTRLLPVLRSGLLSWRGLLRAGQEPLRARPVPSPDVAVGVFLRTRFGDEVVDRLVNPLLGSLHGGDVDRLGVAGAAPQLLADVNSGRSLLLRRRRTAGPAASVTWVGGTPVLAEALASGLDVRTGAAVTSLERVAGGCELAGEWGSVRAGAVVLAVPAAVAAMLLRDLAPEAAGVLAATRTASVATVVARYPRAALPAHLATTTGLLVPSSAGTLLKAATVLSVKWPHLVDDDDVLLRLSAGRAQGPDVTALEDGALLDRLAADLNVVTGMTAPPSSALVHRWRGALAQLEVGHVGRTAAARAALAVHPGLLLAGASYDGLGIAACARSGERAAQACLVAPVAVAGR